MVMAPEAESLLIPPLSKRERALLDTSIRLHGVLEPVLVAYDDPQGVAPDGEIIDGLNRSELCAEIGIEINLGEPYELTEADLGNPMHRCPVRLLRGLDADARRNMAFMLNWSRRQLQVEQQREIHRAVARRLQENPLESNRRLAQLVGITEYAVREQRRTLESTGAIPATVRASGGQQGNGATGSSRVIAPQQPVVQVSEDEDGEPTTQVAEHMQTGSIKILYRHWAPSTETRQRGDMPYAREMRQQTAQYGPFVVPPEAQNNPAIAMQAVARQFVKAFLADPLPKLRLRDG